MTCSWQAVQPGRRQDSLQLEQEQALMCYVYISCSGFWMPSEQSPTWSWWAHTVTWAPRSQRCVRDPPLDWHWIYLWAVLVNVPARCK